MVTTTSSVTGDDKWIVNDPVVGLGKTDKTVLFALICSTSLGQSLKGLTVTANEAVSYPQLLPTIYQTVSVPPDSPVNNPALPIAASAELLLIHKPPAMVLIKVAVSALHKVSMPEIIPAYGRGFTVTAFWAVSMLHTLLTTYKTVSVPAESPANTPVVPTDATDPETLCQLPPTELSLSVIAEPAHTESVPVMWPALGREVTVMMCVLLAVPQAVVTI